MPDPVRDPLSRADAARRTGSTHCRCTMSGRANGRAIWSCCTRSPKAPPTAATALPSPSSPGLPPLVARARQVGAGQARGGARRDRRDRRRARRSAAVRRRRRRRAAAPTRWPKRWPRSSPTACTPREALEAAVPAQAAGRGAASRNEPRSTRSPTAARSSTAARSPTGSPRIPPGKPQHDAARRILARRARRGPGRDCPPLAAASPAAAAPPPRATAFLPDQIVRLAYDFVRAGFIRAAEARPGDRRAGRHRPRRDGAVQRPRPDVPDRERSRRPRASAWSRRCSTSAVGPEAQGRPFGPLDRRADRAAKKDMTVRTAFLEARWIWGDEQLLDRAMRRFRKEVVAGTRGANTSPPSSPSATSGTSRWATAAMSSSPTSRTARAGCATSTRSTGSANMCTASNGRRTWSTPAC